MTGIYWPDLLNLLNKLSWKRIGNGLLVWTSYYLTRWFKRPIQWGLPLSISFEPTTSCNLRCPECPSGLRAFSRPTGMLSDDFFRKTIDELSPHSFYLLFYFQGEPYLNPEFLNMVRYASQKGMYTATSTNAHYLNEQNARDTVESGLDRLIISLDGTTQEVYEQYRIGGNLEKVLQGARNIVAWKRKLRSRKPYVFFQFLVVKPNEHQMEDAKKLAAEIGVDGVKFKTAQVYDYEFGNPLIPENETFSRYKKLSNGRYVLKNKMDNHCWKLWHACVITWDGQVVPCCFDKDAQYRLGDLRQYPFRQIWQNHHYKEFRSRLIQGRQQIDICSNCSEGTKVWGKE